MRSYVIACEFYRGKKGQAALTDQIRCIAEQWEQPNAGTWLVRTELPASAIRSALLPHLDFKDRIFICEAGEDRAEFNALPACGVKVTNIEMARERSRLLAGIFSRNGRSSRHLRAATSRSLQSA
jgi:hypothetical protein